MSTIPFEPVSRPLIRDTAAPPRSASSPSAQSAGLFDRHLYGGPSAGGSVATPLSAPSSAAPSTDSTSGRLSPSEANRTESSTTATRHTDDAYSRERDDETRSSESTEANATVEDGSSSVETYASAAATSEGDEASRDVASAGASAGESREQGGSQEEDQSLTTHAADQHATAAAIAAQQPIANYAHTADETDSSADAVSDSTQKPGSGKVEIQGVSSPTGVNGSEYSGDRQVDGDSGAEIRNPEITEPHNAAAAPSTGNPDSSVSGGIDSSDGNSAPLEAFRAINPLQAGVNNETHTGPPAPSEQQGDGGQANQASRRRNANSAGDRVAKPDAPGAPAPQAADRAEPVSPGSPLPADIAVDSAPDLLSTPHAGADKAGGASGGIAASAADTRADSPSGPRGAEPHTTAPTLSESDHTRFMQRVVRAVHAAHQRDGEVRLRLSPPELGSLRIELRVQSGAMTARIEAEMHEARSLLLEGLPQLRERLAEQGIRVEQFDVELLDRQGGQSPQYTTGDDPDRQQSPNRRGAVERASETSQTSPNPAAARRVGEDGQLNVLI